MQCIILITKSLIYVGYFLISFLDLNFQQKLSSDGDGNHENKEKMMVGNDKEKDISKNSSGAGGGDVDEKEIGEDGGSGQEEYVVEKILDKRYNRRKKRIEYLIKWAGYDSESENTWESAENCVCSSAVPKFKNLQMEIS